MNEIPGGFTPDSSLPEQLLPPDTTGEGFGIGLRERGDAAEELRAAQVAWLERRDIDQANVPHLRMDRPAFDVFRNAPEDYVDYVKKSYNISTGDQDGTQYVLVDIEPDDPNMPHDPALMVVTEVDFGTTIDRDVIDRDFQPDSDSDNPSMPGSPDGALRTVDIAHTLAGSWEGLQTFTEGFMQGITTDPFSSDDGDTGVRAGGLAPGQRDAYVWTSSPVTRSIELTLAFPSQYDSVCVVRGQRREAANGKPAMAQIENPTVVLRIEGETLVELQRIYRDLYHEPDFALTEMQRGERDELLNVHLVGLISEAARGNRAQEQARQDDELRARQQPLLARERPLS